MKTRILFFVGALVASFVFSGAVPVAGTSFGGNDEQKDRDAKRGWLGVSIQDVTPKFAKSKELAAESGAYVAEVRRDSPADSAGIKEGDVITEFNGQPIDESYDLQRAVGRTEPGTKVKVKVVRKKETKTLDVRVGVEPARARRLSIVTPPRMPMMRHFEFSSESDISGLRLMELNDQLAKYFDVPEGTGALVKEVEKESAAEKAGFKAGDVIVKVGKRRVDDVRDVMKALKAYDEGEKAEFEIIRKGNRQTISLEVTGDYGDVWFDFGVDPDREGREFHLRVPPREDWEELRLDLENIRPELGEIEIEMGKLYEQLREIGLEIRDRIRRELPKIEVRTRIIRSI